MDNEIQAWHNYLNFEEKEGDHMRTIKLYERCLVACVRCLQLVHNRQNLLRSLVQLSRVLAEIL